MSGRCPGHDGTRALPCLRQAGQVFLASRMNRVPCLQAHRCPGHNGAKASTCLGQVSMALRIKNACPHACRPTPDCPRCWQMSRSPSEQQHARKTAHKLMKCMPCLQAHTRLSTLLADVSLFEQAAACLDDALDTMAPNAPHQERAEVQRRQRELKALSLRRRPPDHAKLLGVPARAKPAEVISPFTAFVSFRDACAFAWVQA